MYKRLRNINRISKIGTISVLRKVHTRKTATSTVVLGSTLQWRRKGIKSAAAKVKWRSPPGRVWERGATSAQPGGMGERCKLPHGGLGRSPRSQRFLRRKTPPKMQKLHLFISENIIPKKNPCPMNNSKHAWNRAMYQQLTC